MTIIYRCNYCLQKLTRDSTIKTGNYSTVKSKTKDLIVGLNTNEM